MFKRQLAENMKLAQYTVSAISTFRELQDSDERTAIRI
jgi:hypothetical protein